MEQPIQRMILIDPGRWDELKLHCKTNGLKIMDTAGFLLEEAIRKETKGTFNEKSSIRKTLKV